MISIEKLLLVLLVWTLRFLFRDVLRMVEGDAGLLVGEEGDDAFETPLVLAGEVMIDDTTDEEGFMYGGILQIGIWIPPGCTSRSALHCAALYQFVSDNGVDLTMIGVCRWRSHCF